MPALPWMGVAPSPFSSETLLELRLGESVEVDARIFDAAGRRIRHLADGMHDSGTHRLRWDGRADDGRRLPDGLYVIRVVAGGNTLTRKVVRLRP